MLWLNPLASGSYNFLILVSSGTEGIVIIRFRFVKKSIAARNIYIMSDFFTQSPPELSNPFQADRVLQNYLRRKIDSSRRKEVKEELTALGDIVSEELYEKQLDTLDEEPELIRWDAWGNRVDRVKLTDLWERCRELSVDYGLVADPYDTPYDEDSRLVQFAKIYLVHPSTGTYTCPLAMTDGAAFTIAESDNEQLQEDVLPHLTSRDEETFWTCGQWMTETTGGSDVGRANTVARKENGNWKLYGRKFFTSAVSSRAALTLARPEGNPDGGEGLALFYIEIRDEEGRCHDLELHRLKDKLGTRKLPTAEVQLKGTPATPVHSLKEGVKEISSVLNMTRCWNSVCSVSMMRRGIMLARDYARKREAFGSTLAEKPLHVETLSSVQAEFEGAFHLTFRLVEILSRLQQEAESRDLQLLYRTLTAITKLTTAKQAVAVASECLEMMGGQGYIEDTGFPEILRDAQVLPIWEGTTNVLSLDVIKLLAKEQTFELLRAELLEHMDDLEDEELTAYGKQAVEEAQKAFQWLNSQFQEKNRDEIQAGARRVAMTLGRCLSLMLLSKHAQWVLDQDDDERPKLAARYYADRTNWNASPLQEEERFALGMNQ